MSILFIGGMLVGVGLTLFIAVFFFWLFFLSA
jgi:hypothetical protein